MANENLITNSANKLLNKYHQLDGIFLSDEGFAAIKSIVIEQPKKTRVKRKNLNGKEDQEDGNKELEENLEDKLSNDVDLKQNEDEKKKKLRRLRLDKLGIGGFSVKHRSRLSLNK